MSYNQVPSFEFEDPPLFVDRSTEQSEQSRLAQRLQGIIGSTVVIALLALVVYQIYNPNALLGASGTGGSGAASQAALDALDRLGSIGFRDPPDDVPVEKKGAAQGLGVGGLQPMGNVKADKVATAAGSKQAAQQPKKQDLKLKIPKAEMATGDKADAEQPTGQLAGGQGQQGGKGGKGKMGKLGKKGGWWAKNQERFRMVGQKPGEVGLQGGPRPWNVGVGPDGRPDFPRFVRPYMMGDDDKCQQMVEFNRRTKKWESFESHAAHMQGTKTLTKAGKERVGMHKKSGGANGQRSEKKDGGDSNKIVLENASGDRAVADGITKALSSAKEYLQFFGYGRVGHSMIGALIDAHPKATVADEMNAIEQMLKYFPNRNALMTGDAIVKKDFKRWLIEGILRNNYVCSKAENNPKHEKYRVPGMYQGDWKQGISVIGDRKGGFSTSMLNSKDVAKRYMHVMHSPYDMVAQAVLMKTLRDNYDTSVGQPGFTLKGHEELVKRQAQRTRDLMQTNLAVKKLAEQNKDDKWLDVYMEDFIVRPSEGLKDIATFLGLDASDDWIKACTGVVTNAKDKSTCSMVTWSKEACDFVKAALDQDAVLKKRYFETRTCCKEFS